MLTALALQDAKAAQKQPAKDVLQAGRGVKAIANNVPLSTVAPQLTSS